jgi:hypothetical protein
MRTPRPQVTLVSTAHQASTKTSDHGTQRAASRAEEESHNGKLVGVAVLLMFIFPIGGFIAGCVLLSKRAAGAGAVIMCLSVVSGYVWYDFYAEHQRHECLMDNVDRAISGYPTLDCG